MLKARRAPSEEVRLGLLLASIILVAGCSSPREPTPPSAPGAAATSATPASPSLAPGDVRLAIGDSWNYRTLDANGTTQGSQSTTVTQLTGTTAILSTRNEGGSRASNSQIEARQGDLAIVSLQSDLGFTITYEPPLPLVIPAADHAQTGSATLKGPTGTLATDVNLTVKFLGRENVTVLAGSFEALRYHIIIATSGAATTKQESDVWFAPSVKAPVKTLESNGRVEELTEWHVA